MNVMVLTIIYRQILGDRAAAQGGRADVREDWADAREDWAIGRRSGGRFLARSDNSGIKPALEVASISNQQKKSVVGIPRQHLCCLLLVI